MPGETTGYSPEVGEGQPSEADKLYLTEVQAQLGQEPHPRFQLDRNLTEFCQGAIKTSGKSAETLAKEWAESGSEVSVIGMLELSSLGMAGKRDLLATAYEKAADREQKTYDENPYNVTDQKFMEGFKQRADSLRERARLLRGEEANIRE